MCIGWVRYRENVTLLTGSYTKAGGQAFSDVAYDIEVGHVSLVARLHNGRIGSEEGDSPSPSHRSSVV